jgi:MoaA/NifB/PqqE/SkfB family radical SAM enzyme
MIPVRLKQGLALARDWIAPGEPLAQWTHFVTSVCNARCAHCFYPINAGKNELTLEEIERFVSTLPPIRLLLISGGEPFLRRDLPEIIRVYFERCGVFDVGVPTNGFAAAEIGGMVEKICSFSRDLSLGVSVSIDGFQAFHDRVRAVPGLYDRALATLESLLGVARSTPNLTVGVTTVFMRDNQEEVEDFCRFVYERYRPSHHSLGLIRGDAYDPALKEGLDIDRYERLSGWLDARYPPDEARTGWRGARTRARREINRRRFEYIARQARGGRFEGFCLAGEREFVLTEDGTVHGCELIGTPLGNVRESGYDFAKIRGNGGVRKFVDDKHGRLCRCTHECNARTMILFDRANALPVLGAMAGIERSRTRPSFALRASEDEPS